MSNGQDGGRPFTFLHFWRHALHASQGQAVSQELAGAPVRVLLRDGSITEIENAGFWREPDGDLMYLIRVDGTEYRPSVPPRN